MIDPILGKVFSSQWTIFLFVTAVLVFCAWVGARLGMAAKQKNPDAAKGHSGSLQGAVLGLLGLLLGFTFAMAVNRFDNRRSLVVAEANAIGTTWLRTDFLQGQAQEESRSLLKRYTESRLRGFQASDDPVAFARNRETVSELHAALWAAASQSANQQQNPVVMGYVNSLNEMIDLDASRIAASRNHVPGAVWLLLVLVGGCGAWANGYSTGATGVRSIFTLVVFPVLIAIVITLISDIDQSRRGLIGMSQKPLEDLLSSMNR
jgi:hypothetical protein